MNQDELAEYFEPGGLVSRMLDEYEYREPQVQMAKRVESAIEKRHPLAVEAGTGTGKTLSYLLPAFRAGKRIVISTATKALQSQLVNRDIPLLQKYWPSTVNFVQLKGRRNYLCLMRYHEMGQARGFESQEAARNWAKVQSWANHTETGDRGELDDVSDSASIWSKVTTGSSGCLGQECNYFDDCFVYKARKEAQEADIIVVNHHLFFANLSLQSEGVGSLLPEYDAVIFDEAHHIDDVATSHFTLGVSPYRIDQIARDIETYFDRCDVSSTDLRQITRDLNNATDDLFELFEEATSPGRHELKSVLKGIEYAEWHSKKGDIRQLLDQLGQHVAKMDNLGEMSARLSERCMEIGQELNWMLRATDSKYAFILDHRETGIFLEAAPIDVADILRRELLETHDRLIFTSATLRTKSGFDFFKKRLGVRRPKTKAEPINTDFDELGLPEVFDYEKQSCLYVPESFPEPRDPDYINQFVDQTVELVRIFNGRAFILFTSHRNLDKAHYLAKKKLNYPVLRQGDYSKDYLLEKFRDDPESVLFATRSFWEGVDVEGEALQLVAIDKLPFANPSDPLTSARLDYIDDKTGNAFRDYSLPSAALALKQGFGRLIRSKTDTGMVAVFDIRLRQRRYGRYFLESLPPVDVIGDLDEVQSYWNN